MKSSLLNEDIQYMKGVGPAKAKALNKLEINTYGDAITYYPREYEDRTNFKKINEFIVDENVVFVAKILTNISIRRIRKSLTISTFYVGDQTGKIQISIFNQTYMKNVLEVDKEYAIYGKVTGSNGRLQLDNPVMVDVERLDELTGFYPIYPLTQGLTNNYIFKLVNQILNMKIALPEIFSTEFRKKYELAEINFATEAIHKPANMQEVEIARRRLIFEELYLLQLALISIKNRNLSEKKGIVYSNTDYSEFLKLLPFELTGAQKRCLEEIEKDMSSDKMMNRLVQGDVGSGKTIVAAITMYIAVKNGYQAALMAPTTILANQHYEELKQYFEKLGMKVDIITGNTTKKNKEKIVEKLKSGEINILIGTHAIIEDNVEFKNLGIIVTDEQHRFGVKQRMKLNSKGENPDVMVMTATPIPRTLALMVYSDLDMSIIDELPKGRIPIKTYVVDESFETRINSFIKKEIAKGRQAYVVCPLIEENEELDLTDAKNLYEKYKTEVFKEYNVGFLHGKMKNKEKDEIMNAFKEGKIDIVISTTVIEVGVNVPNATLMVIEDADRFGLATLHQLRGRVGRSIYESYCVLKSKNKSKESKERLNIMSKSNDGFEIAEKDLDLRGPGDFFGIRQHGLPEFKLANLLKDVKLLKLSNEAAKETIASDPNFDLPENKVLKKELFKKYKEQLTNIGT